MSWIWSFNFLTIAILGAAALRWGRGPERLCVAALLMMNVTDRIYHALAGRGTIYGSVDIGHLIIDGLVAGVFIAVALHANRIYPLWLSAFQLVSVVSHFAREASGTIAELAYFLMNYVPYYCVLLILTAGIVRHALRTKRHGPYRSWRISSRLSPVRARAAPPIG